MKVIVCAVLMAALCAGCSTVTPLGLEVASESPRFGMLSETEAVEIIKSKTRISGEKADYRTYVVDEVGFAYKKTTKKTRTEWRKGEPHEIKSTHVSTFNVPWNAITDIWPHHVVYDIGFLGEAFRVRVDYNMSHIEQGARVREERNVELICKTREDLVDVVAALRMLSGK